MIDENQDQELDGFFKDEGEEISTEPEAKAETTEPIKGDTEETPPAESPAAEEPVKEAKEPVLVPLAALENERRKRQQLQEDNQNLRQQIPKVDNEPDPYDDIDAYNAYQRNKWEQENHEKEVNARRERVDLSRGKMLQTHSDFEEMERIFEIMTIHDNSLIDRMFASGDEAKFAYEAAKAYKEGIIGKPDAIPEPVKASALDVPNLATATTQASNMPEVEKEDGIDDIFADQSY